jgi:hypothetical protein
LRRKNTRLGGRGVGFILLYFFGWGVFLVGAFDLSVEVVLEGSGRMAYEFFEGGADDF